MKRRCWETILFFCRIRRIFIYRRCELRTNEMHRQADETFKKIFGQRLILKAVLNEFGHFGNSFHYCFQYDVFWKLVTSDAGYCFTACNCFVWTSQCLTWNILGFLVGFRVPKPLSSLYNPVYIAGCTNGVLSECWNWQCEIRGYIHLGNLKHMISTVFFDWVILGNMTSTRAMVSWKPPCLFCTYDVPPESTEISSGMGLRSTSCISEV